MKYLSDLLIGCSLLYGLVFGFIQGGFRKLWRLIIFALVFVVLYLALKDISIDFIRYDLLNLIKPEGLSFEIQSGYTITVTSIEDLFVIMQNLDENLTGLYLKLTCEVTCKLVFFIVLIEVALLVSNIISWPTWHLVKFLIPSKFRKHIGIFQRLFGGAFGVIEWLLIMYLYAISFGQIGPLANKFIPILENVSQLASYMPQIKEGVNYLNLASNPDNSYIMRTLFDMVRSFGKDPLSLLSFTYQNKKVYIVDSYDPLIPAINELIESFVGSSSNETGETIKSVSSNIRNVNKIGFNYI